MLVGNIVVLMNQKIFGADVPGRPQKSTHEVISWDRLKALRSVLRPRNKMESLAEIMWNAWPGSFGICNSCNLLFKTTTAPPSNPHGLRSDKSAIQIENSLQTKNRRMEIQSPW
jgi:hypothetical protein